MDRAELVKIIETEKLVFVTRLKDHTKTQAVMASLISVGANVVEITTNTPNYTNEISEARKSFPKILIGAGTVTNEKLARESIEAGAQFLVTPNTNLELVKVAHEYNVPILMGALTPSEVSAAHEAGADFVKLFPADIMGVSYFKSITAPLNNVKLLAVGGIELNTVDDWMAAGAHGIGIASVLKEPVDLEDIKKNASNFISKLAEYR